ncbi:hypothetical protein [Acinetobacter baumannii]|uniref:hypothetical protein n=1 Tax=Acinetobacter baumannii TaxID=470 RepID=UPI003D6A89C2
MKAVCTVVGNVVFDGDVIFINAKKFDMTHAIFLDYGKNSANFIGKGALFCNRFNFDLSFKLMFLWIWHIVILRKSHVYLTKALK